MAEFSTNSFRPEDFKHLLKPQEPEAPVPSPTFGQERPSLSKDMEKPVTPADPDKDPDAGRNREVTRVRLPDTMPQAPSTDTAHDPASELSKVLNKMSEEERALFIKSLGGQPGNAGPAPAETDAEDPEESHDNSLEDAEEAVARPVKGWRKILAAFGIGTTLSAEEMEEALWVNVIRKPVTFPTVIGVTSFKGGCGKTTSSAVMGLSIAQSRPDSRVIIVDLDPSGNLATRARGKQSADVQGYAAAVAAGSTDPYAFTSRVEHNLDILGSRLNINDPELTPAEVVIVIEGLMQHYDFVIVDMPQRTDAHSYTAMLAMLDVVVFLFEAKDDALSTVMGTRTVLESPATEHLIDRRIIAFNHARPQSRSEGRFNPGDTVDHLLNVEQAEVVELSYAEDLFWAGPLDEPVIGSDKFRRFVQLTAAAINMIGDHPPASRPSLLP